MNNVVEFVENNYKVTENGQWLKQPSIIRKGNGIGKVTVDVYANSSKSNTAIKDKDYNFPKISLVWNDGELGEKFISPNILQDSELESDEIFTISLTKLTNASYGLNKKCTIILTDDDNSSQNNLANLATKEEIISITNQLNKFVNKEEISKLAEKNELLNLVTKKEIDLVYQNLANIPTKDDLTKLATKDDLLNLVSKSEINDLVSQSEIVNLVDKNDLLNLATKTETNNLTSEINKLSSKQFIQIEYSFANMTYFGGYYGSTAINYWEKVGGENIELINGQNLIFKSIGTYEINLNCRFQLATASNPHVSFHIKREDGFIMGKSHVFHTNNGNLVNYRINGNFNFMFNVDDISKKYLIFVAGSQVMFDNDSQIAVRSVLTKFPPIVAQIKQISSNLTMNQIIL
jgi:Calx-beta domain